MKNWIRFAFTLTVMLITLFPSSGCASTGSLFGKKAPAADAPNVKIVGGDLLQTFVKNDPEGFLKLLPDGVREEFGVNGFRKTRESMLDQLGTPVSYTHVLNLEHPAFTVSIWKIRFERKSSDQKKVIHQETLFRAISAQIDGKDKLIAFNFF